MVHSFYLQTSLVEGFKKYLNIQWCQKKFQNVEFLNKTKTNILIICEEYNSLIILENNFETFLRSKLYATLCIYLAAHAELGALWSLELVNARTLQ